MLISLQNMSFSSKKHNFLLQKLNFLQIWVSYCIADCSWEWSKLSNVIYFQNKVWYLRCSILKNSTILKIFWTHNDLAWITAIFCFKKYDTFLPIFCKTQNFGLLVWSICGTPKLFDIGGLESIIWSPPNSNGLVIGPLLASGGRKNLFFWCGVEGWNNHLHMMFLKLNIFQSIYTNCKM